MNMRWQRYGAEGAWPSGASRRRSRSAGEGKLCQLWTMTCVAMLPWLLVTACAVRAVSSGASAPGVVAANSASNPLSPQERSRRRADLTATRSGQPTVATRTASRMANQATTLTSTTSTTAFSGCGGVERCIQHEQCRMCLSVINASNTHNDFPHSMAQYAELSASGIRAYDVRFFKVLQTTASCSDTVTPPGIFHPALQELTRLTGATLCMDTFGMSANSCLVAEYACFVDRDCKECLNTLHTSAMDGNGTKITAFNTRSCAATSQGLLDDFVAFCGESFPRCSLFKQRCASLPECLSCLDTLSNGDGAKAARLCRGTQMQASALDGVVSTCFNSNTVACDFWGQRCADNSNCSACLERLSNGVSARLITADWSTSACQAAAADSVATQYLKSMAIGCPSTSTCQIAITNCVYGYGDTCLACLNGSAPTSDAAYCSALSQHYYFETVCQECPTSVHIINAVVFATATVGGASAAACVAVATTIVAHGRDRASMRDRILVGLMIANAIYSTANAIPINALRTGVLDCGRLALSFDTIRFGRAWWFCGKYGLVSFELLILGASIQALHRGVSAVPRYSEAAMHTACCIIAALAFAIFYVLCARINANGYNARTENVAYTNIYHHGSETDDFDDTQPSATASGTVYFLTLSRALYFVN